jgi:hypothetical protein
MASPLACEVIAAHAVVLLEVADDGLDGGPPFEFALDLRRDAALLAARVDLELVIGWGVVAAIAGIGDAAMENVADERPMSARGSDSVIRRCRPNVRFARKRPSSGLR